MRLVRFFFVDITNGHTQSSFALWMWFSQDHTCLFWNYVMPVWYGRLQNHLEQLDQGRYKWLEVIQLYIVVTRLCIVGGARSLECVFVWVHVLPRQSLPEKTIQSSIYIWYNFTEFTMIHSLIPWNNKIITRNSWWFNNME